MVACMWQVMESTALSQSAVSLPEARNSTIGTTAAITQSRLTATAQPATQPANSGQDDWPTDVPLMSHMRLQQLGLAEQSPGDDVQRPRMQQGSGEQRTSAVSTPKAAQPFSARNSLQPISARVSMQPVSARSSLQPDVQPSTAIALSRVAASMTAAVQTADQQPLRAPQSRTGATSAAITAREASSPSADGMAASFGTPLRGRLQPESTAVRPTPPRASRLSAGSVMHGAGTGQHAVKRSSSTAIAPQHAALGQASAGYAIIESHGSTDADAATPQWRIPAGRVSTAAAIPAGKTADDARQGRAKAASFVEPSAEASAAPPLPKTSKDMPAGKTADGAQQGRTKAASFVKPSAEPAAAAAPPLPRTSRDMDMELAGKARPVQVRLGCCSCALPQMMAAGCVRTLLAADVMQRQQARVMSGSMHEPCKRHCPNAQAQTATAQGVPGRMSMPPMPRRQSAAEAGPAASRAAGNRASLPEARQARSQSAAQPQLHAKSADPTRSSTAAMQGPRASQHQRPAGNHADTAEPAASKPAQSARLLRPSGSGRSPTATTAMPVPASSNAELLQLPAPVCVQLAGMLPMHQLSCLYHGLRMIACLRRGVSSAACKP